MTIHAWRLIDRSAPGAPVHSGNVYSARRPRRIGTTQPRQRYEVELWFSGDDLDDLLMADFSRPIRVRGAELRLMMVGPEENPRRVTFDTVLPREELERIFASVPRMDGDVTITVPPSDALAQAQRDASEIVGLELAREEHNRKVKQLRKLAREFASVIPWPSKDSQWDHQGPTTAADIAVLLDRAEELGLRVRVTLTVEEPAKPAGRVIACEDVSPGDMLVFDPETGLLRRPNQVGQTRGQYNEVMRVELDPLRESRAEMVQPIPVAMAIVCGDNARHTLGERGELRIELPEPISRADARAMIQRLASRIGPGLARVIEIAVPMWTDPEHIGRPCLECGRPVDGADGWALANGLCDHCQRY